MLKKLRTRFIVVMMLVSVVLLGIIFGTVIHFTRSSLEQESIQTLQSALETDSDTPESAPDETPKSAPKPDAFERENTPEPEPMDKKRSPHQAFMPPYLVIEIADDETVRLIETNYGMASLQSEESLKMLSEAAMANRAESDMIDDYGVRYLKQPSSDGMRIAFVDATVEAAALASLIRTCIVIGVLCLVGLFLLAFLFARWAVRPVERAWKQQTQFVSDASHELKTPVAVILSNAELLSKDTCTDEQRTRYASNILQTTTQMKTLVNRLLELARSDNASGERNFERVCLSDIAQNALLPFEPLFYERGLFLESEIASDIDVIGDSAKLAQVIDILLDNAQKYSAPNAKTVVRLTRTEKNRALLTVRNEGEHLSSEELENLFERFYRADAARAAGEGYGLGLPIALSIATEHGGRMWATSEDGWNAFNFETAAVSLTPSR